MSLKCTMKQFLFILFIILSLLNECSSSTAFTSLSCPESVVDATTTLTFFVSKLKVSPMNNVVANLAKVVVYCQGMLIDKVAQSNKGPRLLGFFPTAMPLYIDSGRSQPPNISSRLLDCETPKCFKSHLTLQDLMDEDVCTEGNACFLMGRRMRTIHYLDNNDNATLIVNNDYHIHNDEYNERDNGHVVVVIVVVASGLMVGVAFFVVHKMLELERERSSSIMVTNETRNAYYTSPSMAMLDEQGSNEERMVDYENVVIDHTHHS